MAEKEGSTPSKATNSGQPGGDGQSKASIKTEHSDSDLAAKEQEYIVRDKYTDGMGNPTDNVKVANPNRNTDKGQQS